MHDLFSVVLLKSGWLANELFVGRGGNAWFSLTIKSTNIFIGLYVIVTAWKFVWLYNI